MANQIKLLFGLDESDFSRNAVAACGRLIKDNEKMSMTLFHGVPESLMRLSRRLRVEPAKVDEWKKQLDLGTQKLMNQSKDALTEAGFAEDRISVLVRKECDDPATEMLRLADSEGYGTVAVARWGAGTAGRQVIGSVTYRLSQSSEKTPAWVVDPRISSRNILVCLVGAEVSRRVVEYVVDSFGHLRENTFTLFHIAPAVPPGYRSFLKALKDKEFDLEKEMIIKGMKDYSENVKAIAKEAEERLIQAGVPKQNIVLKFQAEEEGIARDILSEIEEGNHGILVIGRKGSSGVQRFGLGSKAYKLLCSAQTFLTCLVN